MARIPRANFARKSIGKSASKSVARKSALEAPGSDKKHDDPEQAKKQRFTIASDDHMHVSGADNTISLSQVLCARARA